MKSQQENNPRGNTVEANVKKSEKPCQPACPACGGSLIDIRASCNAPSVIGFARLAAKVVVDSLDSIYL